MRVSNLVWILAAASALVLPTRALAYRTALDAIPGATHLLRARNPIPLAVGAPPPGVDAETFASAVSAAAAAWDLECSGVRMDSPVLSGAPPRPDDGVTTVATITAGWAALGYAPRQAAITEMSYRESAEGWVVEDADIFLNADTFDWTASSAPDLVAVLHHELGHVLGLAHPCEHFPVAGEPTCEGVPGLAASSVMFPDYQMGAHSPRTDDVEAVCALYPFDPCAAIECRSGQTCRAGECIDTLTCADGQECTAGVCALEGEQAGLCVGPGTQGSPCETGSDCMSMLCISSTRVGSYCTSECRFDSDCSGMQRCAAVGGRSVCAPLEPRGCSVAVYGSATPEHGWFLGVALSMIGLRRRRRKSR